MKRIQDAIIDEFYDTLEPSSPSTSELMEVIRELRQEVQTLRNEINSMKGDIKTLDVNATEIDDDVADIHRTVDIHTRDIKALKDDMVVLKDEMGAIRNEVWKRCKSCDAIKSSVSVENTIAQNRIWRLYSNNFHQNLFFKNSNLLTQFSLLQSSPRTTKQ